ncbi:metal-dependent hydrolase [Niveibacterium sp. 24ML]|uniref:metal-dependent hydrolase n=1 Tax=Niveibacterium sp. 24ML TaxID=2985512 RepID=UPI0022721605|nr:metal-dependent hydrolase [Niveibacterium sp. 24ML]MCX9158583.1 metal-dependent hydrolase [Niveibacterium sp. 24ML]
MSSFIGHASVGAAVYFSQAKLSSAHAKWALPLLVFLSIAPDLDYPFSWWLGMDFHPRITHSLLFCIIISLLAWLATTRTLAAGVSHPGLLAFCVASCSHIGLDLLVGVHSVPVFWPFSSSEPAIAFGVLPSAGHLNLWNYYLWRNLLIECGVLLPFLWFFVAIFRGTSVRSLASNLALICPIWLGFLVWSIRIHN